MDIQRRNEYKYNVYPLMRVDNKYKNGVNRSAAIKIILVEQISQLEDTYRYWAMYSVIKILLRTLWFN